MSFDMDQSPELPNFSPWFGDGALESCEFEVGPVSHGTDGALRIVLLPSKRKHKSVSVELVFLSPLAVRIAQEGSLMDYWNRGFVVGTHNVFVATASPFLNWLEHSSSGVHSVDRVKHYAVFSDDICVEVLSTEAPEVRAS